MRFKQFAKPLSRIFGPESPVPAAPADPSAALAAAARDDAAESRAAAIRELPDGDGLRTLAGLSGDVSQASSPALERIAQERIAQLIDAGAIDFTALRASTGNISALLAVAGFSGRPERLPEALASIEDPAQVARLVTAGSSSRIRQLAAQAVSDPVLLKQLRKQLRGRDKGVYKIINQKCEVLHAEEQRVTQIEHESVAACESLERHSHRIYDVIYEPTFRHFHTRWQALEPQAAPDICARAHRAIARCQEIIAEHLRQLERQAAQAAQQAAQEDARQQAAALAEAKALRRHEVAALEAAEAAAHREAEEKVRAEESAAQALALRQVGGLIAKAQTSLRDGNTGRASGLRRALEEKLPALPAVPPHLARQVHQLDAKLHELKEWKEHAAAPKRAELIVEMEGLIGSAEDPKALAERIKQLQEDWKTVSKGVVSDSEADWQRFHQAGVSAYQPCREYFEAQSKLRESNAQQRRTVLDRLRAFEASQSGEHPDWRMVATVLREAPLEWRRYFPVDRATSRALQEEFDASIARLQGRIVAWQTQNIADKKSLIERARQLSAKEDGREAVDAIKRLQLLWKDVGPAPREQEQPLWTEFRAQCDAVFQKRQQVHAEYSAALDANKSRALAVCEEAEQIAGLTGPALLEGAAKARELRAAFESLGEVPRAEQRTLRDRFERALKRAQDALSQQREREKAQSLTDLLAAAGHIRAYGWASSQGAASCDRDALKQAAETFIAGVEHWPKGSAEALKVAWAKADAASNLDPAAQERALRLLCIRSEILWDRSTPPEDEALRREYQMQRLVQRMGRGGDADADDPDAMALEWVRVGPVSAETHDALLQRFLRCR